MRDEDLTEGGETFIEALRRYARAGDTYVTFTTVPKVGVNPRSEYGTPIGVYGYILTPVLLRDLEKAWRTGERGGTRQLADFALDAPYVNLYTVKQARKVNASGEAAVIRIGPDGRSKQYTALRFGRDLERLQQELGMTSKEMDDALAQAKKDHSNATYDFETFWALTHNLSVDKVAPTGKKPQVWWNAALRRAGIVAVADYGSSTIHPNEPFQAVVLDGSAIKVLAHDVNPLKRTPKTSLIGRVKGAVSILNRAIVKMVDDEVVKLNTALRAEHATWPLGARVYDPGRVFYDKMTVRLWKMPTITVESRHAVPVTVEVLDQRGDYIPLSRIELRLPQLRQRLMDSPALDVYDDSRILPFSPIGARKTLSGLGDPLWPGKVSKTTEALIPDPGMDVTDIPGSLKTLQNYISTMFSIFLDVLKTARAG